MAKICAFVFEDEEPQLADRISDLKSIKFDHVFSAQALGEAKRELEKVNPNEYLMKLCVCDLKGGGDGSDTISGWSGWNVIEYCRKSFPSAEIWILTGFKDEVNSVYKAIAEHGFRLFSKDHPDEFKKALHEYGNNLALVKEKENIKNDLNDFLSKSGIIADNLEMLTILSLAKIVAATDIKILITGESGVGKEVFAKAIHQFSKRSEKKLVAVNCGAIPEGILESELFGHKKGSFTGASDDHRGYFEIADGSTLFLDEIAEMPLTTQVKLLRVIENQEFMRIGDETVRKFDVRIITATNKDLQKLVDTDKFRNDLYFRIKALTLNIPPLRNRRGDIIELAVSFLKNYSVNNSISQPVLTKEASEILINYNWPGNVRELKNVIEIAAALNKTQRIEKEDLIPLIPNSRGSAILTDINRQESNSNSNREPFSEIEQKLIAMFSYCINLYDNSIDPLSFWFDEKDNLIWKRVEEQIKPLPKKMSDNITDNVHIKIDNRNITTSIDNIFGCLIIWGLRNLKSYNNALRYTFRSLLYLLGGDEIVKKSELLYSNQGFRYRQFGLDDEGGEEYKKKNKIAFEFLSRHGLINNDYQSLADIIGGEEKRNIKKIFDNIEHDVPIKKLMQEWPEAIKKIEDLL